MRLDILIPMICGLTYMCSGTAVRTQSNTKPGLPTAEVSSLRLTTGEQLVLKCYWLLGLPVWTFSSNVRSPVFVELASTWDVKAADCGRDCHGRVHRATFSPSLAGLYRCSAAVSETFTIMWVNESVLIDQAIVKTNEHGKPLSVSCNVNLLPAGLEYQRQIQWFVSNDDYHLQDVTQCCSGVYSVETTSSPGRSSLIIRNYDASRDYGTFRCTVKIEGYGKELFKDTKIYAELDITFDITTGNRRTPVLDGRIVEVLAGEILNVTCIARGNPSPQSIRLLQNGITKSGETISARGVLRSSISVTDVTDVFNDSFSCESRQEVRNTPVSSPSITSVTVFTRAVTDLTPQVPATEDDTALLSATATIAVSVTIPLLTIIIILVVVWCWRLQKNRSKSKASNGATPRQGADRVPSEWKQPLRSPTREDDRL